MKKLLLATTMLASVTGYATADVSVSGDARMGVLNAYSNVDGADNYSTFSSRVRIKFSGSGVTDSGLAFGGSFRAKEASDADSGTKGSAFVSGAFGKISMGDVNSGDKEAVGQIDGAVGYTGLGSTNSISYAADGGFTFQDTTIATSAESFGPTTTNASAAKALYTYSANGLTVAVSSSQLETGNTAAKNKTSYGIGASYNSGNVTVALGYGSSDISISNAEGSVTDTTLSAGYVMGTTTIKAIYQDKEVSTTGIAHFTGSVKTMGASVKHIEGQLGLTAYALSANVETDLVTNTATASRYGIGATYDLGGGMVLAAGWVHNEAIIKDGSTSIKTKGVDGFDVGVQLAF